ncbi:MAG TPA: hypothetical protein VGG03_25915 [Thermoanaerobaculia bacterium]
MHPETTAPQRPRWSRILPWTAVAGLYTILTLVYLWPLPRLWGDHIGPGLGDPLFVLYVLKWGVHQIQMGLPDFWNANIYYPTRGALALSEHLLGPAAQLTLFLMVVPNAIAGFNFLLLTSFVGSALAVCWVLRQGGLSWAAAALAGWMYAFSPFRLSQMAHLQMLIAQWIPLTLWFWDRLLAERTVKNAALFLLFYLLNLSGGCYLAYMIHFSLLAILASRVPVEGRELVSARSLRVLVPAALVAGTTVAALFLPYARISRALGLTRIQAEIQEFGAGLASYFSPARESVYFGPQAERLLHRVLGDSAVLFLRPENSLFAGFLPTALFFVGAFAAWRRRREGPPDVWARGLALSGLVCFALSLTWVYAPLMRVVPGLSGMRVPARFYAFVSLTVVYFAARGVDVLLRRARGRRGRAAAAAFLAVFLAAELTPREFPWQRLPREEELPDVYRWLRDQKTVRALIELPLRADSRENDYLYAATVHWKPIANGSSGYVPASYRVLTERIRFLPGPAALDLLRDWWITHIVVHARRPARLKALRTWEARFATGAERQVERVYESDGIFVYRLLAAPARPGAPRRAGGPVG